MNNDAIDDPPVDPVADQRSGDWRPLPPRSRALFVVNAAPLALPAGVAGYFLGVASDLAPGWIGALIGIALGLSFALWFGLKQYNYSYWRHDSEGLAVRRGKFWQHETRVPATRVQHLDIKRGPLQRRRDLATLVVHTAGTRNSEVTVPHLDVEDAGRLRDALSRQIDHDYDRDDPD